MSVIVGVHGVGNHVPGQPADVVVAHRSRQWAAALAAGLRVDSAAVNVRYAYWAPILHADSPIAQGLDQDPDVALDQVEGADADTTDLAAAWLDALELPEMTAQGRLTAPLRHAVAVAAQRFSLDGRLTKLFVDRCFPEVARYITDASVRVPVRDDVAAVIAEHQARVVIAHSLGTVITYEAGQARCAGRRRAARGR